MATTVKKISTRGSNKNNKNNKTVSGRDSLISEEDKELLDGVDDTEDESAFDVDASGNDIPESEIVSFLKKLGVEKYRPLVDNGSQKGQSNELKQSKQENGKKLGPISAELRKNNSEKGLDGKKIAPKKSTKTENVETDYKNPEKAIDPLSYSITSQKKQKTSEDAKIIQTLLLFLKKNTFRKYLLFKPGQAWRVEEIYSLPDGPPDKTLLETTEKLAKKLFEEEILVYSKQKENVKNSEARWLKTVLSSGTLADKMAALTLLIQESPIHNCSSLDTLISMSSKKGKREAMMAVDTLRDLFLTGLLPDNRKLRAFDQQPLLQLEELSQGSVDNRDKYLIMWHFEALLKKKFVEFIKVLGEISFDTLQAMKEKALSTIYHLLTKKPEQEHILLPMLVNKMGDHVVKSKAIYLLTKLVDEHPRMKSVIVREVQQLLHRPNVSQRAQYYGICYLTQIRLSESEKDLASQLIDIYFYFFQNFLKKSEVDNKMLSALLTGVNRAYVYAKENKEELSHQADAVYKIIPSVNFHTGVQALMLLHQVTDTSTSSSDRYYMCLYRKLIDPALNNSSKQGIFLNLLFKSLKSDIVDRRIKAFIKRILQVYSTHPPHIICGVLILLSQILQKKPGLVQTCYKGEAIWSNDNDEEHFIDYPAPDEIDENSGQPQKSDSKDDSKKKPDSLKNESQGSWVHRNNFSKGGRKSEYDPYLRNPLYTHAETECTSELHQLVKHYHPTVRLYATMLLKGQDIKYDGDPVKDFTLARFLDRFVYKNPKKNVENVRKGQFKKSNTSGIRAVPINSAEYLEFGEQDIPEDEKFFYRYFKERALRKEEQDAGDDESIGDDEFDAYLDSFEKSVDKDGLDDLDLDFASNQKKSKANQVKEDTNSDLDEDDDDEVDLSDEELAAEFREEMGGLEDISQFSPDEDDELQCLLNGSNKKKRKNKNDESFLFEEPKKKKKKNDTSDLFASAEQFAHLLDEDSEMPQGGINDVLNRDKAGPKGVAAASGPRLRKSRPEELALGNALILPNAQKQLDWERTRHHRLQDKKGKKKHNKRNKFSKGFVHKINK